MGNVIIVGTGPAGISAALYTVRAGINTTVIGNGAGALGKAEKIENYYGFSAPVTGRQLIEDGIAQAKRLGAKILTDEVVGIGYVNKLIVKTINYEYPADCVILATGSSRQFPKIKGFSEYEGRGISYCAVCDSYFYKGKDVAVLGCCEYALAEAMELIHVVRSVTLITNGAAPISKIPPEIKVITTEIQQIAGNEFVEKVIFKDDSEIMVSGVFVAIGIAGSGDLAKKMGAEVNGNTIVVDNHMATSIPGLYAAGDCTGGMQQIAKAVYEGAAAGTEAVKYIRNN
ncbi:MAG: FAD-dependent oxidoreductase [Oscillospiraceae bacterium]|nr:FAD-dependent oxidoreductase [Oscillospiraceae bacterium]